MGRLGIMSDLHVDINKLGQFELELLTDLLHERKITHLHLGGDTANQVAILLDTLSFIESKGISTTFNFGNHELPSIKETIEMEDYPDSRFLNHSYKELNDQLVLLGVNGWYDYSFALEKDYDKIVAAKNLYWYDRIIERPLNDPDMLVSILKELKYSLDALKNAGKQVIVATHFVPKQEFVRYFDGEYERWNQINAFLGAKATGELLETYDNIQQVVFGHTHRRIDNQVINGTSYSARPLGYFYEWHLTKDFMLENKLMTSFNPYKVRRILRNQQDEFNEYRAKHLKSEFNQALTIIDY
ncbi:metallophosphoesterase [Vagococcus carniphilus]|uniref:Metallophosphoesterase n=1 Tax=Vagococcus carniphilus TaxID=218144 RepID=A0AAW8U804_9ENTE|nr:metallophosphoesterase [Vagococcus carniphilus]MDT2831809.1 metallophosphoesterase [Vagococcus carniphilus]MDT2834111.1 metallophosphoesterase [Vagococcus carniphilus]MDT2840662.1 metallophosphoesterase [Vagococcus carniphilus]MDT2855319.1 metallophosphoesterase [Vagococcus carniphilus]